MKIYNKDSILYLGFALPLSLQLEIEKLDEYPHFATNKFSNSIIKSLKNSFNNVSVISTAEIRNYPSVKKLFFKSKSINDVYYSGHFIGFINLILLKHLTRFINLFPIGIKVIDKNKINYILVHGTHTPFMLYAILLKLISKVEISLILTDQHGLEVSSDGFLGKFFRNIDKWLMKFMINKFDSYICLSEAFVLKFKLKNALILPGIVNSEIGFFEKLIHKKENNYFKIVFAGGLNKNNGVDILLKAISAINLDNLRFHILGKGELINDVILASKNDNRIIYEGVKHSNNLLETLISSDLLINPRPIKLDSSRYSFPSKLLEYMSTGVPILTTKLESIPPYFYDCLYFTRDDSAAALSTGIINFYNLPEYKRKIMGENAKEKAIKHYGEGAVGSKIHSLLTRKSNEV
ncbi:glycosyltransferase family 4 protein [Aquirufa rosea]|uniref:Glycosyltransferase n=1 Tax=Aquirufa rosea TaxID=2509241 RepID=A0A4Q1BYX6_9BACT|nr:glycosyltransferase family 4 protein [Aquirufa rosea]RXK48271.1 glycosyltransferase [Aquirufa rosea]